MKNLPHNNQAQAAYLESEIKTQGNYSLRTTEIPYYDLIGYITTSTGLPDFECTLHPKKQYILYPLGEKLGVYRKKTFCHIILERIKHIFKLNLKYYFPLIR